MNLKIRIWDWLLICGIILSPMNSLRIWKVGPAELLCFIWSLKYIKIILKSSFKLRLKKFWILFFISIILGTFYGYVFYPSELRIFDLLTYIYFAVISIGIYLGFLDKNLLYIEKVIKIISILSSFLYFLLFIYSKVISNSFFGMQLWYLGSRFSGGAENPHQLALLIGVSLFSNLIFLFDKNISLKKYKFFHFLAVFFCLIVAYATKSSTLLLSIVISFLLFLYFIIMQNIDNNKTKISLTGFLLCLMFFLLLVFFPKIFSFLYSWISSDENGVGRLIIFKSIVFTLEKNFIFGLGPGIHGINGIIEFHNSYLEIIAMSGLVGFSIFVSFSIYLFKRLLKHPFLILPIVVLYVYGMAGFTARRLVFWVFISLFLVWNEKILLNNKI